MRTILVASDAPSVRREVAAVTEGPDVEVLEVTSGPELFQRLDELEESPDLVVVDTADAVLVCARSRAQDVKHVVEELRKRGEHGTL